MFEVTQWMTYGWQLNENLPFEFGMQTLRQKCKAGNVPVWEKQNVLPGLYGSGSQIYRDERKKERDLRENNRKSLSFWLQLVEGWAECNRHLPTDITGSLKLRLLWLFQARKTKWHKKFVSVWKHLLAEWINSLRSFPWMATVWTVAVTSAYLLCDGSVHLRLSTGSTVSGLVKHGCIMISNCQAAKEQSNVLFCFAFILKRYSEFPSKLTGKIDTVHQYFRLNLKNKLLSLTHNDDCT